MNSNREIEEFLAVSSAYLLTAFNSSASSAMRFAQQARQHKKEQRNGPEKPGVTQDRL